MTLTCEQAVHSLADRVRCPEGPADRRRQTLEDTLVPMVRCVLRTGRGNPRLVQWVRRTLPAGPVDPEQAAGPVARLLCHALLQEMRARPDGAAAARETVAGL
jgi:hypothetical protein